MLCTHARRNKGTPLEERRKQEACLLLGKYQQYVLSLYYIILVICISYPSFFFFFTRRSVCAVMQICDAEGVGCGDTGCYVCNETFLVSDHSVCEFEICRYLSFIQFCLFTYLPVYLFD